MTKNEAQGKMRMFFEKGEGGRLKAENTLKKSSGTSDPRSMLSQSRPGLNGGFCSASKSPTNLFPNAIEGTKLQLKTDSLIAKRQLKRV